jgi:hypothetical protein
MAQSRRDMLASSLAGVGAVTLSASGPARADARGHERHWGTGAQDRRRVPPPAGPQGVEDPGACR